MRGGEERIARMHWIARENRDRMCLSLHGAASAFLFGVPLTAMKACGRKNEQGRDPMPAGMSGSYTEITVPGGIPMKMHPTISRLLSVFLIGCLLVTLVPLKALADSFSDHEEQIEYYEDNYQKHVVVVDANFDYHTAKRQRAGGCRDQCPGHIGNRDRPHKRKQDRGVRLCRGNGRRKRRSRQSVGHTP